MKADCLHPRIEPVALIGHERWSDGSIRQKIVGHAMACSTCHTNWPYVEPWDLPHWLWRRAKDEGWLPMPQLTPEIMKALEDEAQHQRTTGDA